MAEVEQITGPHAHHGEGPVWYDGWDGLRFVDMLAGDILCVDTTTEDVDRIHVGDVAAAFRPRANGGMVVAVERGFAFVNDDGDIQNLSELWDDPKVRMNEGSCDPQGRFYCGSMAYDSTPGAGSVHRLETDQTASLVLSDVTASNGLAWSPDGNLAYYIDTPTRRVDAFDCSPEAGPLVSSRRTVVEIPHTHGLPDGMTVDAEGCLWVALWGGSAVRRYRSDGTLDGVVELPVSNVTACTFGGDNLDQLYITTSRQGLPEGAQPSAGAVFRARPGVRGLPVLPYRG